MLKIIGQMLNIIRQLRVVSRQLFVVRRLSSVVYRSLNRSGQLSVTILFFSAIAVTLVSGFILLASSLMNVSVRNFNKIQAFSVAEAGIEYYRWHLAHAPEDYQDGTGNPGPYTHIYYDKSGNAIGRFVLDITPPVGGSTVVTIKSTGYINADASVTKKITVKMAIPSYAKYAWLLSDNVVFGTAAEVFGPIQSNAGIRFDGKAHNLVSSALTTYDDLDHSGANEWAVHTHVNPIDPLPPTALPARTNIFMAGRTVGVPAVDFGIITQDLTSIRNKAQASSTYFASSTVFGYNLVLATSGIYSVYKVNSLFPKPQNCSGNKPGWGTWSIQNETLYATGTIPTNGVMFFEDDLWVRGQISGKRVTIASGRIPNVATSSSITVNNNLLYTNYDSTDTIALIAQRDINVGLKSDDNLRIDAALMAQTGRIGRYSYSNCGSTSKRTLLTAYGMLGTALRPAFYYSTTNGYQARTYIYDANLLYAPPPDFPLTTDKYSTISWNEVQ